MWLEIVAQYGLFLFKTITVVFAVILVLAVVVRLLLRMRGPRDGQLELTALNDRLEDMNLAIQAEVLDRRRWRRLQKHRRQLHKQRQKAVDRRCVYVLDFDGDERASGVAALREEISALLGVVAEHDEIVVRLTSPGGLVYAYGLAASQLMRIRSREIPLTICVDKIAASGGYMMACVASRILAAPFAIIGSVGVVAQVPNLHRLLEKHDIDYQEYTAGEFKRTVSLFGEIDDKGRKKFQDELEDMHRLFKEFIQGHRPALDVEKIATGEYWPARRALDLGLVDELLTSDDYLMQCCEQADVFGVRYRPAPERPRRPGMVMRSLFDAALEQLGKRFSSRV